MLTRVRLSAAGVAAHGRANPRFLGSKPSPYTSCLRGIDTAATDGGKYFSLQGLGEQQKVGDNLPC